MIRTKEEMLDAVVTNNIKDYENRGIPVYFMKESEDTFDVVIDKNYKYKPAEEFRNTAHKP